MIVYTNDQHYSDIADAIREKTGDTETEYFPSEMAEAISNIPSGGNDTMAFSKGVAGAIQNLLTITMIGGTE